LKKSITRKQKQYKKTYGPTPAGSVGADGAPILARNPIDYLQDKEFRRTVQASFKS